MLKRASLIDIAMKVGVSITLASSVLNGKEEGIRVSDEIAKKIRKTAEELNYQSNEIASSLLKGSTKTIDLVVADISNPFLSSLARYFENEVSKYVML